MFQTKVVEKIKTRILYLVTFFPVNHLWDNVEKCGAARRATDDNIIRRMPIAGWVTKATHTRNM